MRIGFSAREVLRLTGIRYSTLNLWAKNGLVAPSISDGSGSGNERVYSFSDLVALKVALELRKAGVTTRSLQKVVEFIRTSGPQPKHLSEVRLVVSGNDVLEIQNDRQLVSTLRNPGQACLTLIVDLPRTLEELTTALGDPETVAMWTPEQTNRSSPRKPPMSTSHKHLQNRKTK
jgi:DNA-binding transcriptional MerR regulator